ncbi:PhnB protein [Paenibacillus cellulosilyticus]|uniref:PhnB protein n=1 Tax=Paenibacillus cellulosilyticus TaxID=375489 RepID=A0A2V2YW02_9BACL|nr:VOC family protein [Paenibacillus cellulosilyticus]PWW05462.1 PhnB protein [Paenibacillus cellulosilyticus]QKS45498.1 VOC family protein [Paenibacillus cellulosilyticus]
MSINVYLNFNGNTREAVEFYAHVFNTEIVTISTFGESPQSPDFPLPEEAKNLIMHAMINVGSSPMMFSDTFPGMPFSVGTNITLSYQGSSEEELRSIFNKLADGGKVGMELQETFWSKCYGQVTDKFDINWQLNLPPQQ